MKEWENYLQDGIKLHKAASGKNGKPSKFEPTIRYNLFAMALEKNIMAILNRYNDLPENHTFSDLVFAVSKYVQLEPELKNEILELERAQSICSIYDYERKTPTSETVERLDLVTRRLQLLAQNVCIS